MLFPEIKFAMYRGYKTMLIQKKHTDLACRRKCEKRNSFFNTYFENFVVRILSTMISIAFFL